MTEDETFGWHEFEKAPGVGDGQGSLVFCSLWGRKELDRTEQLNSTDGSRCYAKQITHRVVAIYLSILLHPLNR